MFALMLRQRELIDWKMCHMSAMYETIMNTTDKLLIITIIRIFILFNLPLFINSEAILQ